MGDELTHRERISDALSARPIRIAAGGITAAIIMFGIGRATAPDGTTRTAPATASSSANTDPTDPTAVAESALAWLSNLDAMTGADYAAGLVAHRVDTIYAAEFAAGVTSTLDASALGGELAILGNLARLDGLPVLSHLEEATDDTAVVSTWMLTIAASASTGISGTEWSTWTTTLHRGADGWTVTRFDKVIGPVPPNTASVPSEATDLVTRLDGWGQS